MPIAHYSTFTTDVSSGNAPLTVTFTDTSGAPPATAWSWDFGDGSGIDTTQNPVHTYTVSGVYSVVLQSYTGMWTTSVPTTITVNAPLIPPVPPVPRLSPIWNGTQFFDQDGLPLSGGKIFTYYAGSYSSQATTYSDSSGLVANSNPLVLDSSGRVQTEIWLMDGTVYNMVLTAPDGTTILQTCDNITGTVSSGGGGGTSFPLPAVAIANTDNTGVAWTQAGTLNANDSTRIQGTIPITGGEGPDPTNMSAQMYISGASPAGWTDIWKAYPGYSGCSQVAILEVPQLMVDNFINTDVVQAIYNNPRSTSVSPATGYVTIGLISPTLSNGHATSAISTVQTIITPNPYAMRDAYGGDSYRITIYGTCTSNAANTHTFNILSGYYNTLSDQVIGSISFNAATSGTSVPFKIQLLLTWDMASGTKMKICGECLNNGTTGISANAVTIFTPALSSTVTDTNTPYLNVSYQSSAAGTSCVFHDVVTETIR